MGHVRRIILELANEDAFDREWYLRRYSDVADSGADPVMHYLDFGREEGRYPNKEVEELDDLAKKVDADWYFERYSDVSSSDLDSVDHFLLYGRHEGRFPNSEAEKAHQLGRAVDAKWYIERYPDVAMSDIDPCTHYIKHGNKEGRFPNATAEKINQDAIALSAETQVFSRFRDLAMTRVLLIENLLPLSRYGAGFPRTRMILGALLELNFFVSYYTTMQDYDSAEDFPPELPIGAEYIVRQGRSPLADLLEARKGFYTCVIVCRPNNMEMIRELRSHRPELFRDVPLIYDAEAVCAAREVARLNLAGEEIEGPQIEKLYREEINLSEGVAATLVVSDLEAQIFKSYGRQNVFVLGHTVALDEGPEGFADRANFLFVGRLSEDESPNVHALHWFMNEVLPALINMIPEHFNVVIVGMNAAPSLRSVPTERMTFTGPQDDLTPLYRSARVFIAPTQFAAGIPIKVLEAAAHGLPSVVSDLLHRQLDWPLNGGYLSASSAEQFADNCFRLYSDEQLWREQRIEALTNASRYCDRHRFVEVIRSVVLNSTALGIDSVC